MLWQRIKSHTDEIPAIAGTSVILLFCGLIFLNTSASESLEQATVLYSVNTANRYSAITNTIIVDLKDGHTAAIALPPGWVPPPSGNVVRVKRIALLFFGERFVLVK